MTVTVTDSVLTVTSTGDGQDANTGDGICDDGTGSCTLRAAIQQANALSGLNTIAFDIPGAGARTIRPTSALPGIADPVVIDGYTQAGARPNTNPITTGSNAVLMIELDGSLAGLGSDGLHITAGNSTVRGLAINRFDGNGILLEMNGGNFIEGNFIGTNVTGIASLGNWGDGVSVLTPANVIGGTGAGRGNVISGNEQDGVAVVGGSATGNLMEGNCIGTDLTGTVALGNGGQSGFENLGIRVGSLASNNVVRRNVISGNVDGGLSIDNGAFRNTVIGNLIGTRTSGTSGLGNGIKGLIIQSGAHDNLVHGNVISSNLGAGVIIFSQGATGNIIRGNSIGTDITGAVGLANSSGGVLISGGASDNTIGGTADAAGNTITFNSGDGVRVVSGTGDVILGNRIFSNSGLGIDLGTNGVTPNDTGDADTGANNLQNFPVLTSATRDASTTIGGTLNSTANTEFRIEFFSNATCDPSGHGEGEQFLGFTMATTGGTGDVSFTVTLPATVPVGQFITATATGPNNNTSEFSQCQVVGVVDVTPPPAPVLVSPPDGSTGDDTTPTFTWSQVTDPSGVTYTLARIHRWTGMDGVRTAEGVRELQAR